MRPCVRSALRNLEPPPCDDRKEWGADLQVAAGGNAIGGSAGQGVFATLICEAAAPFTLHETTVTGVALKQDHE
jgi:hypothetical protein